MEKNISWQGVYPAVTTSFTQDDQLDLDTMITNFDAQVNAGASGLVLGGTLGEASTLTLQEKELLLRFAVERYGEKVDIIMNIAESTTKDAIAAASQAESNGADGLMLLPPMRYTADARETVAYLSSVAQATSLPIMIYNNPVDYKIEITIEMFTELLKLENIQAVKESTRDISNITRLRSEFGQRLKILTGVDTLALESLLMGADGWVAGLVCAFPEETNTIFNLVKAGRAAEAKEIYSWFLPLLELDINTKLVQNIKLAEVATGLGTEWVRPPRLTLDGPEREHVLTLIENAMAKRPELPQLAA